MANQDLGGKPMKHFGLTEWVDFARGLVSQSQASQMKDHLTAGCSECEELADFCRKMSRVSEESSVGKIPDSVVKRAQAIFPDRFTGLGKGAVRLAVELIYDSFLVPAPAGLRASWQVGWQALYRAGDCSLDLRIEPELHSSRAAVIGQISNHTIPDIQMAGIPVRLKSGRLVVAETESNQFGEFQMEYEQQTRLQLCVYLDGGLRCIQVPLKKFDSDKPAGTDRLSLGPLTGKKRTDPSNQ